MKIDAKVEFPSWYLSKPILYQNHTSHLCPLKFEGNWLRDQQTKFIFEFVSSKP